MPEIITSDSLKAVREALCVAQTGLGGTEQRDRASATIQRLINNIDLQRPLGPDGKHSDRHTPTCGCEDAPQVADPTTIPNPRRWGRVVRGQYSGERVYWDASLAARRENAWTNAERTHRFSADMVQADQEINA